MFEQSCNMPNSCIRYALTSLQYVQTLTLDVPQQSCNMPPFLHWICLDSLAICLSSYIRYTLMDLQYVPILILESWIYLDGLALCLDFYIGYALIVLQYAWTLVLDMPWWFFNMTEVLFNVLDHIRENQGCCIWYAIMNTLRNLM